MGKNFLYPFRPTLGTTKQLPLYWVPSCSDRVKWLGRGIDQPPPHLPPKLKKKNGMAVRLLPLCAYMAGYRVNAFLYIYIYIHTHTFFPPLYQEIFKISFLKLSGFSHTEVSKFNNIFWQFLHGMSYKDIIEVIYIY